MKPSQTAKINSKGRKGIGPTFLFVTGKIISMYIFYRLKTQIWRSFLMDIKGNLQNIKESFQNGKKTYIVVIVLLVFAFAGGYLFGTRTPGDGSGANRVDGNIQSTGEQLNATIAELERAKSTVSSLETTNQQLTEQITGLRETNGQLEQTISDLSASNNEFERIINEGKSRSTSDQGLLKRAKQIVSGIQERDPVEGK